MRHLILKSPQQFVNATSLIVSHVDNNTNGSLKKTNNIQF